MTPSIEPLYNVRMYNTHHKLPTHAFCKFVRSMLYEEPVSQILYALQTRHSMNINVVLFCSWYAEMNHGRLTMRQINDFLEKIGHWHQGVTSQMHVLRRCVEKTRFAAVLLEDIADLESASEQIEQLLLVESFIHPTKSRTDLQKARDAIYNLAQYFHTQQIRLTTLEAYDCLNVIYHIFPGADRDSIGQYGCKYLLGKYESSGFGSQVAIAF